MDRRTLLRLLGVGAVGGLAGCGGPESQPSPTGTPTATEMTQADTTTTDGEQQTEEEPSGEGRMDPGLVTVTVDESVDATVQRIESDVAGSPLTLLATVDHAENAASVDRSLPPTRLLLVGNPDVGTPLMQDARSVAIDLPQKLLVWDDGGQTKVTYNDPQYLARRHGIEGETQRLNRIGSVLNDLATGTGNFGDTPTGTPTDTPSPGQ
ncbi:DUF302 domain-containing protein [Halorientalis pallida]|nr:DUF302 domain-containing protein [Halorientalis pallida]